MEKITFLTGHREFSCFTTDTLIILYEAYRMAHSIKLSLLTIPIVSKILSKTFFVELTSTEGNNSSFLKGLSIGKIIYFECRYGITNGKINCIWA